MSLYTSPPSSGQSFEERWGRTGKDRQDEPKHVRFWEFVHPLDVLDGGAVVKPAKHSFGLLGFESDEGVRRNFGRPGAREGPFFLRKKLGKLSVPVALIEAVQEGAAAVYDCGDVRCDGEDLEGAQDELGRVVASMVAKGLFPLVIGGGHEVAWGHYQGLREAHPQKNFRVLNFDAHFDLRDLQDGRGHSGTPFLQIATDIEQREEEGKLSAGSKLKYTCLGVQDLANTKRLFETAKRLGVSYVHGLELARNPQAGAKLVQEAVADEEGLYATFCLDVISAAEVPGVSAPQPFGLNITHLMPQIEAIARSSHTIAFDVAELCPRLDIDGRSVGVAAYLVATFIAAVLPRKAYLACATASPVHLQLQETVEMESMQNKQDCAAPGGVTKKGGEKEEEI
eukprot:CAMPEP_0113872130 /NCGR_PEP_ID=MMETSP0780_2-20120614/3028_1 /TAXON_ID=652834 /ORGANISM="Palpitomonas bilix" /LENGTH=396 /DNA_ID=CAMNT_0000857599 /DNA_START=94 /DNA_END=1286 /DNA_ORIENTATION=- /assembly_acc=CAM_ASM_000599